MGFEIKFNWALQIPIENNLIEGKIYDFAKIGNRAFPIEIPIDLIDKDREAIAKVHIIEFINSKESTKGKYKILKIYKDEERRVLTNYWIENQ